MSEQEQEQEQPEGDGQEQPQEQDSTIPRDNKGRFAPKNNGSQGSGGNQTNSSGDAIPLKDLVSDLQDVTGIEDEDLDDFSSLRSKYDFLKYQAKQLGKGQKSSQKGNKPVTGRPTGQPMDPLMETLQSVTPGQSMSWQFEPDKLMNGDYVNDKKKRRGGQ
jgi:hypothetical protein